MTTALQPTAMGVVDGYEDADAAASALDDTSRPDDPVPVSVLVGEAIEAGVVGWLADQVIKQCTPHGLPLDGDGGLLPALAVAATERARSRRPGPVTVELSYDPDRQRITANVEPGTSLATLGAACLG